MPHGTQLSERERGQIDGLRSAGKSEREIARAINRSCSAVHKYLANRENYGTAKRSGRPKLLKPGDRRQIIRHVAETGESVRQTMASLGLSVSRNTVWRALKESNRLKYEKYKKKPQLKAEHKEARLNFAKLHMTWNVEWRQVIFSDEKKFNLHGPDGFHYYWHDLRKDPKILSKRVHGGGSVMVWAGFCFDGKTELAIVRGTMKAADYQEMLSDHLLPFIMVQGGGNWIFQQDNASIHEKTVKDGWFDEHEIEVMEWPSRSPDLNPIENLWGDLARAVYARGRQYNSVRELEASIMRCWGAIRLERLENLIQSMPDRIFQTIQQNGGSTKY